MLRLCCCLVVFVVYEPLHQVAFRRCQILLRDAFIGEVDGQRVGFLHIRDPFHKCVMNPYLTYHGNAFYCFIKNNDNITFNFEDFAQAQQS